MDRQRVEAAAERRFRKAQAARESVERSARAGRAELDRLADADRRRAEEERRARVEKLERIREIDPSAGDAAREMYRWQQIVRRLENEDEHGELPQARRMHRVYRRRWVLMAATHPRLRGYVHDADLAEFADDLDSELARARADYKRAEVRLEELQSHRDRGEQVSDGEMYEVHALREVAGARYELELDASMHGASDRRRGLQASRGVSQPVADLDKLRLRRRRELEAFITAKADEAGRRGASAEVMSRLRALS